MWYQNISNICFTDDSKDMFLSNIFQLEQSHDILHTSFSCSQVMYLGVLISFAYSWWSVGGYFDFLLPLFQQNYWINLHQTLHISFPFGLVAYRSQMSILFFLIPSIPRELLNRSSPKFTHVILIWSGCAEYVFILFNMAARWLPCFWGKSLVTTIQLLVGS